MLDHLSTEDEPGKCQPKNYPAHPNRGLEDAMQGSTEETILDQNLEGGEDQVAQG